MTKVFLALSNTLIVTMSHTNMYTDTFLLYRSPFFLSNVTQTFGGDTFHFAFSALFEH